MTIWNVIDRRKRQYRWEAINAVIEPVYHDNSCEDSDQAKDDPDAIIYATKANLPLREVVEWAQAQPYAVTLYLYDKGRGF